MNFTEGHGLTDQQADDLMELIEEGTTTYEEISDRLGIPLDVVTEVYEAWGEVHDPYPKPTVDAGLEPLEMGALEPPEQGGLGMIQQRTGVPQQRMVIGHLRWMLRRLGAFHVRSRWCL